MLKRIIRKVSSPLRALPNFLIIGAQKSGTTSLYNYLTNNPEIEPALQKEIYFFDLHFNKGLTWYRKFFPLRSNLNNNGKRFTLEASPSYLFYPHAPKRVKETLGEIKLIVLLRNPVDRAYSNFKWEKRRGRETRTFEEVILAEEEMAKAEMNKMINDENYYSHEYRNFAYLNKGIYVDQLERWIKYFPKSNLLVLESNEMYTEPEHVLKKISHFLGIQEWKLNEYPILNESGDKSDITEKTRKQLLDYFHPHNKKLFYFLDRKFPWN